MDDYSVRARLEVRTGTGPRPWSSGPPRKAGRVAEFAHVRESNVRSKFVPDFVAQTNAGIDVGEFRSDRKGSIVLAVDVELRLGQQDLFLREQQIGGCHGSTSDIQCAHRVLARLRKARRKPLHPESRPGTIWIGFKAGSNAGLRAKRNRVGNGAVIHSLVIAEADGTALAGAFRFEPELIHVVAKPIRALSAVRSPLNLCALLTDPDG